MAKLFAKRAFASALLCSAAALAAQAQTVPGPTTEQAPLAALASQAYWSAKAQCWADLSRAEASQGDTHGTSEVAGRNAESIRAALSKDQEPAAGAERPIFGREILPAADGRYGRPQWRADLATIDAVMAKYRERRCRTPKLGCLEVARQSVYENLEETQGARWNHGRPEIDKALALASEASSQFEAVCDARQGLDAVDVAQAPALDGLNVPQAPALEVVDVPADMLFKFDQGNAAGMLPGGRSEIAGVAAKIRSYGAAAGSIVVIGHTDRLGLAERNQVLSQERAETVGKLLQAAGMTLPVQATGAGSSAPVTGDSCKAVQRQQALVDCLQPDRRVVVRIMPAKASTAAR